MPPITKTPSKSKLTLAEKKATTTTTTSLSHYNNNNHNLDKVSVDGHVLFDDVIVLKRLRDFLKSSLLLNQTQTNTPNKTTNKLTIEIEPINRDFSIKNKYIYMSMLNKFSKKTLLAPLASCVDQSNTSSDSNSKPNEDDNAQDEEKDEIVLENESNCNELLIEDENSSSSKTLNNPLGKYIESHSLVILESLLLLDNINSVNNNNNNNNENSSTTTPIPTQIAAGPVATITPKNEFHRDSLLMFCLNFGTLSSMSSSSCMSGSGGGGGGIQDGVSNSLFKFKFSNFLMRIKLVFTELDVLKEDIKKSLDEFLNEHVLNRLLSASQSSLIGSENDESSSQARESQVEEKLQIEEEAKANSVSLSDYVFEANIDRVCYLKKPSNCKTIRLEQIRSSTDCFRAMVEFSRRSELNERPLIFVTCHANVTLNRKMGK
jgi:hypothetical protein